MRRVPTIFAALGVAVAAMGLFAAVALSQQRPPVLSLVWQQPASTALDAGVILLDGGIGPINSAPYLVRAFSEARNQTPTCIVGAYGANLGASINLVVNVLGSNDLVTWVPVRDGGILAVDAGFAFTPQVFWDITSGFPYQEIQVLNVGSDGGFLSCTTAVY